MAKRKPAKAINVEEMLTRIKQTATIRFRRKGTNDRWKEGTLTFCTDTEVTLVVRSNHITRCMSRELYEFQIPMASGWEALE